MAKRKLYFGSTEHAQFAPSPKSGMRRTKNRRSEEIPLDGGGFYVDSSAQYWNGYEMEFPLGSGRGYDGIEVFDRFLSGEFSADPYVRFIDLMHEDENLLTEVWAAPGLSERGWEPIHDTIPTFSATGANAYGKPPRKATYPVTLAAAGVPTRANSVFTLIIPPTHKIALGASGTSTGTAVVRVQPINLDGTLAAPVDLTLLADATAPALGSTFSGATYKALRIYITRTSSADSTLTLAALWAQCVLIAVTPTIARHIPGKGHSGLKFRGGSHVEDYYMANRNGKLYSGSITLGEAEPWAP